MHFQSALTICGANDGTRKIVFEEMVSLGRSSPSLLRVGSRSTDGVLTGGGQMGELMRSFDWSVTPYGPVETWPQSLRTAVSIILGSRYPMFVWWGRTMINFYNDAYAPMLGKRHPGALGRSAFEVWADVWPVCGPQANAVLNEGKSTWNEELLLIMERNGFTEEAYFTFSYSPVMDDSGQPGGIFCAVTEETARVLGRRRLKTFRDLGERALVEATTDVQACRAAAKTLSENLNDFPFALIYLLDAEGRRCHLCDTVNYPREERASPSEITLAGERDVWNFQNVLKTNRGELVEDLDERFGSMPAGPWKDDDTKRALVLPLAKAGVQDLPAGFLVAGLSPRLEFNDDYRGFLELAAGHFATAIANARAYQEERKRAEALAELDRVKTAFFSNVSHEFRTPLTLMLGPLEELLSGRNGALAASQIEQLAVTHRNSLRLLKLVNTLLEFSRIEAGRLEAKYEPTELAGFTAELCGVFRAAIERAGMRLVVERTPVNEPDGEPVYVDRDMWEKIVLNLLSNAFKFTFRGEISVRCRKVDGVFELNVRDTGIGIPEQELGNLFKRFHRVEGARGRTLEGSGIGLALVQELVKLHGGRIAVKSAGGKGTEFTVSIPLGQGHLPAGRVFAASTGAAKTLKADAFAEQALRWLPDSGVTGSQSHSGNSDDAGDLCGPARGADGRSKIARVLVADDNADMREYLRRLLAAEYEVITVPDGEAALAAARKSKPDLVLSDVMMPRIDGFGLLRAIRSDPQLQAIPVILLSARAGEESRVEGLNAGADDYLIKPFSARELVARVESHVKMARLRQETFERERKLRDELEARAKERLEQAVAERTESLREAIAQMEEFSYSVSHDLRSPVRAMQGYAKALEEDFGHQLDSEGREYLERIIQGSARMERLIHEVLTYSRASRMEMKLQPVSLEELVREIVRQYPELHSESVEIVLQPNLPIVLGHEPSLGQAVANLLNNAVKFVAPRVRPKVRVYAEQKEGRVVLRVQDNGIGIKPEQQGRLFGMFERIHPDAKYEGTGIGLAIVRKTVERMGGKVGVESDGVNGSTFWIELPAS